MRVRGIWSVPARARTRLTVEGLTGSRGRGSDQQICRAHAESQSGGGGGGRCGLRILVLEQPRAVLNNSQVHGRAVSKYLYER